MLIQELLCKYDDAKEAYRAAVYAFDHAAAAYDLAQARLVKAQQNMEARKQEMTTVFSEYLEMKDGRNQDA